LGTERRLIDAYLALAIFREAVLSAPVDDAVLHLVGYDWHSGCTNLGEGFGFRA